ncbi:hypothetical protein EPO33_05060 [Patescibacteria group bacterium]|nr:MAG: hypothetical protein EPO33_05060 [Patescibacteria group bacterium]
MEVVVDGPFYTSWAYLFGLIAALSYKIIMPVVKHRMRREFRLRLFIIPYCVGMMVTLPLVFMALPSLGPPRGDFFSDFAYAFVTTYAFMDITADLFRLQEEIRQYLDREIGSSPASKDPP